MKHNDTVESEHAVVRSIVINDANITLKFLSNSDGEAISSAKKLLVSTLHQDIVKTEGEAC